ncbi:MAG: nucleotidyltransferase domain-containing protein [Chloroflexi bacterium]|nr:nucleotidyltransferase domain-containing protein [Chloroflexota bacterium]
MIETTPQELAAVQRLIGDYFPNVEARLFGSRYRGTAKPYSDLDIVLVGKEKLDWLQVSQLREAFAESDLPWRVDVLDWHAISSQFQRVIEQGYEVIQEREPAELDSEAGVSESDHSQKSRGDWV